MYSNGLDWIDNVITNKERIEELLGQKFVGIEIGNRMIK